jgi:N-methylhydantoinase A
LLGVDTGGTFTDFALYDGAAIRTHKVLSTPHAPEQAILRGISELGIDLRRDAARLRIVHGSTVATNAVLEGKGVRTAYIANRGLGDVLTIGRQARDALYDLQPPRKPPPVPRELIMEVNARVAADGTELEAPAPAELDALRRTLERLAPRAVAINLLFSYLNDATERAIESVVPAGMFVSRSSDICPEYREYERGVVTWLNAWIGPLMERYLSRLAAAVAPARVSVMQSSCGTVDAARAGRIAVRLLLSGPAGGVVAARAAGARAGHARLLSFDMGGTSTDVALIDGDVQLTTEGRVAGYPVAVAMVDVHTIGAGGGSIALVDAGGVLHVGPQSAGADPGPACYGRGGTQPTVSDANLVLGRLRADAFLGGAMRLNMDAARAALHPVASVLNLTIEQAALGIVRIANEHMTRALRVMSVERGLDPRDFTLVCFGGAGGLHVCDLADALGMRRALIPANAGVLSALGMVLAPPSRTLSRTVARLLRSLAEHEIDALFAALIDAGRAELLAEGVDDAALTIVREVDLQYRGQSHPLTLAWRDAAQAEAQFHALHERRYGHRLAHDVELVGVRAHVRGKAESLHLRAPSPSIVAERRQVRLHGVDEVVPLIARSALAPDEVLPGPALIIEPVTTTFVTKQWEAGQDVGGNILLRRRAK